MSTSRDDQSTAKIVDGELTQFHRLTLKEQLLLQKNVIKKLHTMIDEMPESQHSGVSFCLSIIDGTTLHNSNLGEAPVYVGSYHVDSHKIDEFKSQSYLHTVRNPEEVKQLVTIIKTDEPQTVLPDRTMQVSTIRILQDKEDPLLVNPFDLYDQHSTSLTGGLGHRNMRALRFITKPYHEKIIFPEAKDEIAFTLVSSVKFDQEQQAKDHLQQIIQTILRDYPNLPQDEPDRFEQKVSMYLAKEVDPAIAFKLVRKDHCAFMAIFNGDGKNGEILATKCAQQLESLLQEEIAHCLCRREFKDTSSVYDEILKNIRSLLTDDAYISQWQNNTGLFGGTQITVNNQQRKLPEHIAEMEGHLQSAKKRQTTALNIITKICFSAESAHLPSPVRKLGLFDRQSLEKLKSQPSQKVLYRLLAQTLKDVRTDPIGCLVKLRQELVDYRSVFQTKEPVQKKIIRK